jgi:hypothetical protein
VLKDAGLVTDRRKAAGCTSLDTEALTPAAGWSSLGSPAGGSGAAAGAEGLSAEKRTAKRTDSGLAGRVRSSKLLSYNDGAWRSPVARLLWEQEVPGSNPGAPMPNF